MLLIRCKWSTLINFGFLIKKGFWYLVQILDFTDFNVCSTFVRIQSQLNTKNPVNFMRYRQLYDKF